MEVSTYGEWLEEERQINLQTLERYPAQEDHYRQEQRSLDAKRDELLARFPHSLVAAGEYPEHSYARRWCWRNIGPENGVCDDWRSDYPACPLVLATENGEQLMWKDNEGNIQSREKKTYANPGEHEHEGAWSYLWLGKTGYDYGYAEYCFKQETDRTRFLEAFPTFTWDESWEK